MSASSFPRASASATLDRAFVASAKRLPYLSHEDEVECARRWRDHQDEAAKARLLGAHLRLVISIASRWSSYDTSLDELVSEGNLGLSRALDGYDPERGLRFSTYATWWIRAQIVDYVIRSASLVKIGTSAEQKMLFFKLRRMKAKMGAFSDGDLPEHIANKIANDVGVQVNTVHEMNRRLQASVSLNAPVGEDGSSTMLDLMESGEPQPDDLLIDREEKANRTALIADAMVGLKPRDIDIFTRRRLIDDPLTLEQLGQEYGVSRERIRQIEAKVIAKMKDRMIQRMKDHRPSLECVKAVALPFGNKEIRAEAA